MRLSRRFLTTQAAKQADPLVVTEYPERVIQIGEGRFLRGFVDWLIHRLNERGLFQGSIVVVAPRATGHATIEQLNQQDGLYTVWLRGIQHGEDIDQHEVVTSINRGIDPYMDWDSFLRCAENPTIDIWVSNTTESGIRYVPETFAPGTPIISYPGKLTAYLYRRFEYFHGDHGAGMTILPCELIEQNGDELKRTVLQYAENWGLSTEFSEWVRSANRFCNTLVDRIVTGQPVKHVEHEMFQKLGYEDRLLTIGEPFQQWVIQGDPDLSARWPFADIGLNVEYVDDITPYRLQKVRILNGAHTAMAYLSYFMGLQTVGGAVKDDTMHAFLQRVIWEELIPATLVEAPEMTKESLEAFARSVLERFANPYLEHRVVDLTLNSLSKFRARLLPAIEHYTKKYGSAPRQLSLSLASLLLFYRPSKAGSQREIRDDATSVARLETLWQEEIEIGLAPTIDRLLAQSLVWGRNLTEIDGLSAAVVGHASNILAFGARTALERTLKT